MGVKVNESGTIKNLALDRDDVETLRVKLTIPAVTISAYQHYLKASDFGITNCYATTKYRVISDDKKIPEAPYYIWKDIPDSYKVVVNQGTFNFRITVPCKFKRFSETTSATVDYITNFPSRHATGIGFNADIANEHTVLGNRNRSSDTTWYCTAYICFVLIIENDGEHWRTEAALVRNTNLITEYSALNDNYAYNIASSSSNTFPYTAYFSGFSNTDYLIERMVYGETTYTTDSVITK